MGELRLRMSTSYGEADIAARFDDHTTIGQLADTIEQHFDRAGHTARSLHRRSRGSQYLSRDARLITSDLRNGDHVELALDTGIRSGEAQAAVASLRVINGPEAGRTFAVSYTHLPSPRDRG